MRSRAIPYVPALDGLRGAAVLAVLLFHGGVGWLPGGFLGVDAFFVLSGYLVTTLLLTGDLRTFWERRVRRLVPALLLLVGAVLVAGAVWPLNASPRDALGAVTYLANWRAITTGGGYFASFAAPSAFKHTWSLAVEGQFYVVWPLVVVFVCRRSKRAVLACAGAGALVSAVAMAASYTPYGDPARAYYGTDTRLQALLVGAALSVVLSTRGGAVRRTVIALSGLAGTVVTVWLWHSANGTARDLYRGGFLLGAVATAAIIATVVTLPAAGLSRVLAVRPLRVVGQVSYGIYLWHWPVFLLLTHERTHLAVLPLLAVRLAVTGAFTALSWFLVEVPARTWRPRWRPALLRPVAVACVGVLVLAALASWRRDGGSPATTPAAAIETQAPPVVPPEIAAAPVTQVVAKPRVPGTARVLLLGDSVAETLGNGLRDADGISVVNAATRGCGLATSGRYRYFGGEFSDLPQCAGWPETWAADIDRTDPDLVAVLVGRWDVMDRWYDGEWRQVGDATFDEYLRRQFERVLKVAYGHRLVLLTAPYYRRGERPDGGRYPEDDPARVDRFNAIVRAIGDAHHVPVVDLNSALAPEGVFTKTINGALVRYDGVHVSPAGARLIEPWLYRQLNEALGRGSL